MACCPCDATISLTKSFLGELGLVLLIHWSAVGSKEAIRCKKPTGEKYLLSPVESLLLVAPHGEPQVKGSQTLSPRVAVWQCHGGLDGRPSSHGALPPFLSPAQPARFSARFRERKKMDASKVSCLRIANFFPAESRSSFVFLVTTLSCQLFFFLFFIS